jgi:hypothetical protein
MEECKPIGVPLDPKVKLQRNANGNDESIGNNLKTSKK